MSRDSLQRLHGKAEINPSIYDEVFNADIEPKSLEMSRYLSRLDLDMIADRYTGRYFKLLQSKPGELPPIDPILLAEEIVKLNVSFTPLCDDGSVLGLAVFEDVLLTVCLPNGKIVSYQLSDGDVLIDTGLQQDGLLGRCNFTIAHEAGHHILNRLFPEEHRQMRNRRTHIMYRRRTESVNWVEWQADTIQQFRSHAN